MFQRVESYKHQLAKDLLFRWLMDYQVHPWSWRSPGIIREELPFFEQSSPYYYEHGRADGRILFVPDITVIHQGAAHLLIEVVHTSEVDEEKLDTIKCFFIDHPVEVWEVQAEEILRQVRPPRRIRATKIWSN